ncbi:hypothetical protein M758_12G112300 [Ceratodon purpureus]|uniref:Uncharacterized protein n=1 Tax=Ceratodon purpureus TaxID=3225 RepID=A0A8T0G5U8_CERPU|nr:hypothetical protein KC19_12G108300 [Ceratodon purpureus]KAG0598924.1 hypothetical protein M758_12G112300 [Ceratodon purpureus]
MRGSLMGVTSAVSLQHPGAAGSAAMGALARAKVIPSR